MFPGNVDPTSESPVNLLKSIVSAFTRMWGTGSAFVFYWYGSCTHSGLGSGGLEHYLRNGQGGYEMYPTSKSNYRGQSAGNEMKAFPTGILSSQVVVYELLNLSPLQFLRLLRWKYL